MYAVIETGGKQYRVEVGTELEVELLDVEPGKTITLERVLLVADGDEARSAGRSSPTRPSGRGRAPGPRRQGHRLQVPAEGARRVKKGHRQELTVLRIADIRSAARARRTPAADEKAPTRSAPSASGSREAAAASRPHADAPRWPSSCVAGEQEASPSAEAEEPKAAAPKAKAETEAEGPGAEAEAKARQPRPPTADDEDEGDAAKPPRQGRRPRPRSRPPPAARPRRRPRQSRSSPTTKKDE